MRAFIIHLPEMQHSIDGANLLREQLTNYKVDAELFVGTKGDDAVKMIKKGKKELYPYSIKSKKINDTDLKQYIVPDLYDYFLEKHSYTIYERQLISDREKGKMNRPGVLGCFYSHYRLWEKCVSLDEPIMIFEDDVKIFRGFKPVIWDGVLILSLGKTAFVEEPWKTYLDAPSGIPAAVPWKNFSMPGTSGYAITPEAARSLVKFWRPYYYPSDNAINQFVVKLSIHSYLMGRNTTAEEGNISMVTGKAWSDAWDEEDTE